MVGFSGALVGVVVATLPFGTVRYTGSKGPVSPERPIRVCCSFNRGTAGDPPFQFGEGAGGTVTANGGVFTLTDSPDCDDVILFSLDLAYDPTICSCCSRQLRVGEPFLLTPAISGAFTFDDGSLVSGLIGTVSYTGSLGPPNEQAPLLLRAFHDAALTEYAPLAGPGGGGGGRADPASGRFEVVTLTTNPYYLQAFFDLNGDFLLSPGEPFSTAQGPFFASPDPDRITITFGDENIPAPPSPTPTITLAPSHTATPRPTSTPGPCFGDCNADGSVVVSELITAVRIALGQSEAASCPRADTNADGSVAISELVAAVGAALNGCRG